MRRRLALTLLPLAASGTLVAALLVALDAAQTEQDVAGTPAEVEKREFAPVPEPERAAYTPAEAAAVAVVDTAVPALQSGTIVAELEPHDLPGFELLGVTWTDGVPAVGAEVQVRWRQDGAWSSWTRLDIDSQEVEGGLPGTEPKWVGPSDAAQARVVAQGDIDPTGLTLVTVSPGDGATLTPAAATQPGIISRSQWGARGTGGCDSPRYGNMQGTIVHHTAGSNNYSAAQSAGIVRSIQAYHMDGQKWCDVGYNFMIDRYGQIFEGRAGGITNTPRGAHAGNYDVNLNTTGISLMGTFVNDVPPPAMKDAAVRLTAWRHSLYNLPAKGTYAMGGKVLNRIAGHYNVTSTACPGQQTINWMNAPGGMRDQVEAAIAAGTSHLVTVAGRPEVWLVAGGSKHHVTSPDELTVFASRLGGLKTVGAGTVDVLPTGRPASRYVHDARTGTLYLLQADGTKHRFTSPAQVATYGYAFESYVDITAAQSDAFPTGAELGDLFTIEDGPHVYIAENGTRRHVLTGGAFTQFTKGKSTFVARMSRAAAESKPVGPAYVESSSLVHAPDDGRVFMAVGDSHLVHIPSFDLAYEAGAGTYTVVAAGSLARNPVNQSMLTPFVRCDGSTWLAQGGSLRQVTGTDTGGWTPTVLPDGACASLPRGAASGAGPFFIEVPGQGQVYVLASGQLHHVRTGERLWELNGARPLQVLSWSAATAAHVGVGAPELAAGTFVQFTGQGEVYKADGRTLRHVTTYTALLREGGGKVPPIEQLPASDKSYYTVGTPIA